MLGAARHGLRTFSAFYSELSVGCSVILSSLLCEDKGQLVFFWGGTSAEPITKPCASPYNLILHTVQSNCPLPILWSNASSQEDNGKGEGFKQRTPNE